MVKQTGQRAFPVTLSDPKKPAVICELRMEQMSFFNNAKLILI